MHRQRTAAATGSGPRQRGGRRGAPQPACSWAAWGRAAPHAPLHADAGARLVQAVGALRVPRRQRGVVQQAEAHLVSGGGVVARRAADAEAAGRGSMLPASSTAALPAASLAAPAAAAAPAAVSSAAAAPAARHHRIHQRHRGAGCPQRVCVAAGGGKGGPVCRSRGRRARRRKLNLAAGRLCCVFAGRAQEQSAATDPSHPATHPPTTATPTGVIWVPYGGGAADAGGRLPQAVHVLGGMDRSQQARWQLQQRRRVQLHRLQGQGLSVEERQGLWLEPAGATAG